MENIIALQGISTALLTPFQYDGRMDVALYCRHANQLLRHGTTGVTLFGTTGEGASIGLEEREAAVRAMLDSGVEAEQMTLGVCATAVPDAVVQVRQGTAFGITKFLLLPPFYFKGIDDEGLFDWHSQLFESSEPSARFILYHIPQVTHVALPLDLILRLREGFPDRVMALKDSAGIWEDTRAILETRKIPVLVGDERLLHKAVAIGGIGSICGMANLYPKRLHQLFETQTEDLQLSADVDLIVAHPVIPALKQAMVAMTGNTDWGRLRAPLKPLDAQSSAAITARFAERKVVA